MKPTIFRFASVAVVMFAAMTAAAVSNAQAPNNAYPSMAPLDQYLMADRDAEIAMARSAAPDSISHDAEIQILSRHGYEVAAPGKNGFVCLVLRSFSAGAEDAVFWNPKIRGPVCMNAASVRTYLPIVVKKTELALSGKSVAQIGEAIDIAISRKQLPTPEPGAMCFMMSKQAYLSDDPPPNWRPHLMFFAPLTDASAWGADLTGSPVISAPSKSDHLTIFMVPVRRWSDGQMDSR